MKKNKGFFHRMICSGESDAVSSKRFISLTAILMLIILAFFSAFNYSAAADYVYVFAALAGGESLLTTIEKKNKRIKKTKNTVAEKEEEVDD